nr:polysaccharide deacetylase family protein [Nannocystis sp. SCPEA4]
MRFRRPSIATAAAACQHPRVPVHVSIHDVSPAWEAEVDLALQACAAVGIKPGLLVIPNYHGAWPLDEHPAYAARLRGWQAAGHEIFLHGYYHLADAGPRSPSTTGNAAPRGLRRLWAQKVVSGGEAEFSDVDEAEARRRLDDGEAVLRRAGLQQLDGFIAPAWSMPPWMFALLRERGYRYTEDHLHVYDPKAGARRTSVVLNYASRTPARLWSSLLYCRLARPARRLWPARVAIHPADMRHAVLRREIDGLLRWAVGDAVVPARALVEA